MTFQKKTSGTEYLWLVCAYLSLYWKKDMELNDRRLTLRLINANKAIYVYSNTCITEYWPGDESNGQKKKATKNVYSTNENLKERQKS